MADRKYGAAAPPTTSTIRDDNWPGRDLSGEKFQNVAFIVQSAGEIVILIIVVGIMFGLDVNASTANNNWGLSVLIEFASGLWLLLAIPYFIIEKRRPGQVLPPNMNIVSVGLWQLYRAFTQIWRLKQSLLYLIGWKTLVRFFPHAAL